MSTTFSEGFNAEIFPAIENGLEYWRQWFDEPGVISMETTYEKPREAVAGPLRSWRHDRAIIDPIVEGTRELTFAVKYEDPYSLQAFWSALARLSQSPRRELEDRNLEGLSEPIFQMARIASKFCIIRSWQS